MLGSYVITAHTFDDNALTDLTSWSKFFKDNFLIVLSNSNQSCLNRTTHKYEVMHSLSNSATAYDFE